MQTSYTKDTYHVLTELETILRNINITVDPESEIGKETKEGMEIIQEWKSRQI